MKPFLVSPGSLVLCDLEHLTSRIIDSHGGARGSHNTPFFYSSTGFGPNHDSYCIGESEMYCVMCDVLLLHLPHSPTIWSSLRRKQETNQFLFAVTALMLVVTLQKPGCGGELWEGVFQKSRRTGRMRDRHAPQHITGRTRQTSVAIFSRKIWCGWWSFAHRPRQPQQCSTTRLQWRLPRIHDVHKLRKENHCRSCAVQFEVQRPGVHLPQNRCSQLSRNIFKK